MKGRRRFGATGRREATEDPEVGHAFDAMSAPELRAAIRVVLDQLDDGVKTSVTDALLARGGDFPQEFASCDGLKNGRLARCRMSIG